MPWSVEDCEEFYSRNLFCLCLNRCFPNVFDHRIFSFFLSLFPFPTTHLKMAQGSNISSQRIPLQSKEIMSPMNLLFRSHMSSLIADVTLAWVFCFCFFFLMGSCDLLNIHIYKTIGKLHICLDLLERGN